MPGFLQRQLFILKAFLRIVDLVACFLWLAPLYAISPRFADRPNGRQLISWYVGKAAYNNAPWALRVEKIIDWLAVKVGDQPLHCRHSYDFYKPIDTPD